MRRIGFALLVLLGMLFVAGCREAEDDIPIVETELTTAVTESTAAVQETFETELPVQTYEVTAETATATEVAVTETKSVVTGPREMYHVVLEQYRETLLMDSEEYLDLYWNGQELEGSILYLEHSWDRETCERIKSALDLPNVESKYPFVNRQILYYVHQYKGEGADPAQEENLQYAYYDVDGNGREELIVARYVAEERYSLIGMYALANDAPVTLDNTVGDRSHLTIYTDGTIGISGSSGASSYSVDYYRLDDYFGAFPDPLCSFTIDTDNPDAERIRDLSRHFEADLIPVESFDWQPLLA